ncbi:zinc finger domain-containing protein [Streptomyces mirabilis]|uniref:zinc finger domain-containing protein n=1 Tax=Streptomyces mirabilis TaxID=68239 RepID=UPI003EB796C8
MDLTPDQAAFAVERNDCPKCEAPAGSACRTRSGKCATKYHTARFILAPALREELAVPVPEDCGPGRPWKPGPPAPSRRPLWWPSRSGMSHRLTQGGVLCGVSGVIPGAHRAVVEARAARHRDQKPKTGAGVAKVNVMI